MEASALMAAVMSVIAALEDSGSLKIAVLERTGDDPSVFWTKAAEVLCDKTGSVGCSSLPTFMLSNTDPLGLTTVLTYDVGGGREGKVCAVLPPEKGVSASFAATAISNGGIFAASDLPRSPEMEAWIMLYNAARCFDEDGGSKKDLKRADAFATLTLGLLDGDPAFLSGQNASAPRYYASFRNKTSNGWAASISERILLDLWKDQAAAVLRDQYHCSVNVIRSDDLNTEGIKRDASLPADQRCMVFDIEAESGTASTSYPPSETGTVSDANLYLWIYGDRSVPTLNAGGIGALAAHASPFPGIGMAALNWVPMGMFKNVGEGVAYTWKTAASLSEQY